MSWYLSAFEFLSHWAVQSTVVLAVAAIAVACLKQPAKKLLLIQASFVVCLILPGLVLLHVPQNWSWRWPSISTHSMASRPVDGTWQDADMQPAGNNVGSSDTPWRRGRSPSGDRDSRHGVSGLLDNAATETPPLAARRPAWPDARLACVIGYLAGVALMAAWWLMGWIGLARVLRRSRPADARFLAVLQEITGPRAACVRLRISSLAGQPFMFGWWRPVIVLPERLASGGPEALRWSLAHEWSHAARGDAWWWSLAGVVRLVLFYQPLAWWLRAQMRLAQDYLADADAAGHAPAPEDYAQFLTAWAGSRGHRPVYGGLGILGRKSELYRRVAMLVQNPSLDRRCSRIWKGIITCLVLAVFAIVASCGGMATEPPANAVLQVADGVTVEVVDDETVKVEEKQVVKTKDAAAQSDRNGQLRYAGRSFDDWRDQLLNDLDGKTCVAAMEPIATFGKRGYAEKAIAALVQTLHDDRDSVVDQAAGALAQIGPAAVPALIEGLTDPRPQVRRSSANALGSMGGSAKTATKELLKLLTDQSDDVRSAGIVKLIVVAGYDDSLRPALERIAASDTIQDKQSLFFGLQRNPPQDGWPLQLLLQLSEDDNVSLRAQAGSLLAYSGPSRDEVVNSLKRLVCDLDQPVWNNTLSALANGSDDNTATRAIVLADMLASPELYASTRSVTSAEQIFAVIGAAHDQAAITVPVLIDIVDGKIEYGVSEVNSAIEALGKLGPAAKAAIPALERVISEAEGATTALKERKHYDDFTPKFARRALRKIRGADKERPQDNN
jgi:beta-lactamase regulating signal transducer with metallopeptidase domain/HEAT repeat protein